jgi:hypothetical protein
MGLVRQSAVMPTFPGRGNRQQRMQEVARHIGKKTSQGRFRIVLAQCERRRPKIEASRSLDPCHAGQSPLGAAWWILSVIPDWIRTNRVSNPSRRFVVAANTTMISNGALDAGITGHTGLDDGIDASARPAFRGSELIARRE